MQRKAISWILDFTSKLPNEDEKINCLRANGIPQILDVLKLTYDPRAKWLLPPGAPPYTVNESKGNLDQRFYSEIRKLYLFIEGGNPNLNQIKRESLFISVLENVHPEDAKLLLSMKEKKLPYSGLNSKLILKAFPGLY
jgi:hypothetical protein